MVRPTLERGLHKQLVQNLRVRLTNISVTQNKLLIPRDYLKIKLLTLLLRNAVPWLQGALVLSPTEQWSAQSVPGVSVSERPPAGAASFPRRGAARSVSATYVRGVQTGSTAGTGPGKHRKTLLWLAVRRQANISCSNNDVKTKWCVDLACIYFCSLLMLFFHVHILYRSTLIYGLHV